MIWVALVYWTYADASRRLEDPMLVACATAASLFPFIGTIVYTIVRPPEYLEDRHERELEIKAAEKRLALLENRTCRNCGAEVGARLPALPDLHAQAEGAVRSCGKPLDPRWRVCPYCEAEVAGFRCGGRRAAPRRARQEHATEAGKRAEREPSAPSARDRQVERDRPRERRARRREPRRRPRRRPAASRRTSQPPPNR